MQNRKQLSQNQIQVKHLFHLVNDQASPINSMKLKLDCHCACPLPKIYLDTMQIEFSNFSKEVLHQDVIWEKASTNS